MAHQPTRWIYRIEENAVNILDALRQVPDWQVIAYNVGMYFFMRAMIGILRWIYGGE